MPLALTKPGLPDPENWTSEGVYAIAVIRDGAIVEEGSFTFPIPPQATSDNEESASEVQPTQGANYYVETRGLQTKVLSIRGTTGVTPAMHPALQTIAKDITTAIDPTLLEKTGFYLFHRLRYTYRLYHELIAEETDASRVELHYFNTHDAEFFRVVPVSFRTDRTSSSPLTYQYELSLRVTGTVSLRPEVLPKRNAFDAAIDKVNRWRSAIYRSTFALQQGVAALKSVGVPRFTSQVEGAALALGSAYETVTRLPRTLLDTAGATAFLDAGELADRLTRFLDRGVTSTEEWGLPTPRRVPARREWRSTVLDSSRDIAEAGTAALLARDARTSRDAYDALMQLMRDSLTSIGEHPIEERTEASRASRDVRDHHRAARRGEALIPEGSEDALAAERSRPSGPPSTSATAASQALASWTEAVDATVPADEAAFRDEYLGVADPRRYTGVFRRVSVREGDEVRALAQQYLGSWRRWRELVAINNLVSPYIASERSPLNDARVLAPGDDLLVPARDLDIPVEAVRDLVRMQTRFDTAALGDLFLGVDVLYDANGRGRINARGDVDLVIGREAFAQNVRSRMSSQVGTLVAHPTYGIPFGVGEKASAFRLRFWRAMMAAALSDDDRVRRVERVQITRNGDVVTYDIALLLRIVDTAVIVRGVL